MEKFNKKRFGRTLQQTLRRSRREYLSVNTGFLISYVLYSCFCFLFRDTNVYYIEWQIVHTYFFIYLAYLSVGGCFIFNNMKTKENRISFIMLPATNLEKYLARYIYASVFWILAGIVTLCVATLLCMPLSFAIRGSMIPCLLPGIIKFVFPINMQITPHPDMPLLAAAIIMVIFWYHTFTILCGTIYRRNQVVFTWITTFILAFIASLIFNAIENYTGMDNSPYDWDEQMHHANMWSTVVIILCSVFIIVNYVLSYVIFRRMQAVNNKWINL